MEIKVGYLYHIKDEFFDLINDKYLMLNHENGHSRPNYFVLKEDNYYWAIPLSSRIEKYKNISNKKNQKLCTTIMFCNINNHESTLLLQNAFPITKEYIKNIHSFDNKISLINKTTEKEILKNFKKMLILKDKGINLFYPDVDRIKSILNKKLVH